MRRETTILVGLVAAHIVLHFTVWRTLSSNDYNISAPNFIDDTLLMVLPAQGSLIGIWMVGGGTKQLPWRLVVGVVVMFGIGLGCKAVFVSSPIVVSYVQFLIGQAGYLTGVLLPLRLLGLRIVGSDSHFERSGPFQFSLSDIFNWMTATAVLLAFFKCLPREAINFVAPLELVVTTIVGPAFALVAVTSTWLVFGRRWLILRCLGCVIALVLGAVGLAPMGGGRYKSEYVVLFLFSAQAGWLIASLLAIRFAGFRFAWQWRFARPQIEYPPQGKTVEAAERSVVDDKD